MFAELSLANWPSYAKVPVRSAPHRDFHFLGLCSSPLFALWQFVSVNCSFPPGACLGSDDFDAIDQCKQRLFPNNVHMDWEG